MSDTAEDLYEAIRRLPANERLRLVARVANDLAALPEGIREPALFDWSRLAGAAPGLLEGEDAQVWVRRSRQESDDHRGPAPRGRK